MSEAGKKPSGKKGNSKDKFGMKPPMPKKPFNFYWIWVVILVVLIFVIIFDFGNTTERTTPNQFFNEMLEDRHVQRVEVVEFEQSIRVFINPDTLKVNDRYERLRQGALSGTANPGPHYVFTQPRESFEKQLDQWQKDHNIASDDRLVVTYNVAKPWTESMGWLLPIIIMVALWIFIMRRMGGGGGPGGQLFNIGKSKATLFDKETAVKVTFNDVAGLEGAKEEIQEIVDFLQKPDRYTNLGAKIPKGALLVGPPGTGKTLLAKAVAGEAQVPFFSLSGSDFVEMFVGVGASRVRDLFKQAKEKSPSIIFIDEIDAIGRARGKSISQGANDERENTLNQLLTEMDGFGTNSGVILLAATNRADILDKALLRPGRFDRQIHVDMPDLKEREEIFTVHLKPLKLDTTVDKEFLAKQTPGFSGADIANICNEAALIAARKNKTRVDSQDFLDAVDRIIGGLEKKNKIITPTEKKVIAYHEAGHATVSWLLEHASPLVKVTIVPRGRSLGAAWYLPEERQITTFEQMHDEICAALGGRAAEEVIFGKISTGALSDLEKITKQAYAMVSVYGLNKRIGNISFYDSSGAQDYFTKPYSEKTAQAIDEEVYKIIENAYQVTLELLRNNKDKLAQLADQLLEKEVIFKEDVEKIFGKRLYEKELPLAAEKKMLEGTPSKDSADTPANSTTEVDQESTDTPTTQPDPPTPPASS